MEKMGGPQLMGSGKMFASAIGEDYDWSSYGWQVIRYPKAEDIRAGDILNWETSGTLATSVYGHTGVVTSVSNGGQSLEQWNKMQKGDKLYHSINEHLDYQRSKVLYAKLSN